MNVKHFLKAAAVVIVIFFFVVSGFFDVYAEEDPAPVTPPKPWEGCPEYDALKKRSADIGGYAWNIYTGWIANQYRAPDSDGVEKEFGIKKRGYVKNDDRGGEISGSSKVIDPKRKDFGILCWGESCKDQGALPLSEYNDDELNPPTGSGYTRDKPFAELDLEHPEKMCQEFGPDSEPDPKKKKPAFKQCNKGGSACEKVFDSCAAGKECEPLYKPCELLSEAQGGGKPAYCLYPVYGWMKIISLKSEGWVRLRTRLTGNRIPEPARDNVYNITDPGTFNLWENWGDKLDCSNDAVYRANKKVCTRGLLYDARKREFYGWAWSPFLKWISFSGGTLYDTRQWKNPYWCSGPSCTTVHYNAESKRSRWSTRYLGVWVQGVGGNLFSKKGFQGANPPPGEFNTDYLIVTGRYTEGTEVKKGTISDWEGRCDDATQGTRVGCFKVARSTDIREGENIQEKRQGTVDVSLPVSSERVNRSLIKRSMVGTLDVAALMPSQKLNPPICIGGFTDARKNDYGNCVVRVQDEKTIFGQNKSVNDLRDTIFYFEGDLDIGSESDRIARSIPNGGSATIVVKGNVIIRRPITYGSSFITSTKKLASLTWVILERDAPQSGDAVRPAKIADETWNALKGTWKKGGNALIDSCLPANGAISDPQYVYDRTFTVSGDTTTYTNKPEADYMNALFQNQQVTTVAGSFFVQNVFATGHGHGGQADADCSNLKAWYKTSVEKPVLDVDGKTVLNPDGSPKMRLVDDVVDVNDPTKKPRELYFDVPLEIRGVIVAKNILFDRVYRGVNRGSETIINTGRHLVNPSPGIQEFVRSLPLW